MAVALDTNPFVDHLKPKADDPALDATVLQGFFGDAGASHGGRRRIYFSMALKEYAEFKGDDVLHRGKIPKEHHPLGLEIDTVWLKQEAEITYVPPTWWPHPGYGGMYLFPGPYGGGPWAGAYGPYGGGPWAGAYEPYGGGPWAGAYGPYGGGPWAGAYGPYGGGPWAG